MKYNFVIYFQTFLNKRDMNFSFMSENPQDNNNLVPKKYAQYVTKNTTNNTKKKFSME